MSTTTETASINKRVVTGTHVDTGEQVIFSGPTGRVIERNGGPRGNRVTIETPDSYRCTQADIMGAVTFH